MKSLNKLCLEIFRVAQVLPVRGFIRWFWCFLIKLPVVVSSKSLGCVDTAFGTRFVVHFKDKVIRFEDCSFGVVREIFGAECYGEMSRFEELQAIVDFGANVGVFTIFVLSANPVCRVYSVEAQPELVEALKRNLTANGLESRCQIFNGFIGEATTEWAVSFLEEHPEVKSLDTSEFFSNLGRVDFLKCDIEGAEFGLFTEATDWTRKVSQISAEYHWNRQDGERLEKIIQELGFETALKDHGNLGYVIASRAS